MTFENHLTTTDMQRAAEMPISPSFITGAHISQLNAIEAFWVDVVNPFVHEHESMPIRQLALTALCDRMIGHARVVPKLNSLVYQQSVTAAERSVIELWLDIQLLHLDLVVDGPRRLFAWAEYQKLASARRTDKFFADHPALDESPSSAEPHRSFIALDAERIDRQTAALWPAKGGRTPSPQHWSNMNLMDRAKAVGSAAQLLIIRGYDMRNFAVHSGVAAVTNVPSTAIEFVHVQSVTNVANCMVDALRILGNELKIGESIEPYDLMVEYIAEQLPSYSIADAVLRDKGEPQRYFFKEGHWGVRDLSGDPEN